jgi:hypothetical protein
VSGLYMAGDPMCICVPRCSSFQSLLWRLSLYGAFGEAYTPYTGYMWLVSMRFTFQVP